MSLIPGLIDDVVKHHIFEHLFLREISNLLLVSKNWHDCLKELYTTTFTADQLKWHLGPYESYTELSSVNVVILNADRTSPWGLSHPYIILDKVWIEGQRYLKVIQPLINGDGASLGIDLLRKNSPGRYWIDFIPLDPGTWMFYECMTLDCLQYHYLDEEVQRKNFPECFID